MKPWDKLTDLEKREETALCLGWERRIWVAPSDNTSRVEWKSPGPKKWWMQKWQFRLPDWPTNDGLAFDEVYKILQEKFPGELWVGYNEGGRPCISVMCCGKPASLLPSSFAGSLSSNTFADVLCNAAYELMPEPRE